MIPKIKNQNTIQRISTFVTSRRLGLFFILFISVILFTASGTNPVKADEIDDEITALKAQIAANQSQIAQLNSRQKSLNNEIAIFNAQIAIINANIQKTRAEMEATNRKIAEAEAEARKRKGELGASLSTMYIESQLTTLERVMSAASFSEFIGQYEYLSSVRQSAQENMIRLAELKNQLAEQKKQLVGLEGEQSAQYSNLAAQRSGLANLLYESQNDEAQFQRMVSKDEAKVKQLRAQQAAAIAAKSSGTTYYGTGSYPWAGAQPFPNYSVDPWGFYVRQCTSYAAWKRAAMGQPVPVYGNRGYQANAGDWPGIAAANGYRVDSVPEVGAIGILPYGPSSPYGHAGYVLRVEGSRVLMSQYNAEWQGLYSEAYYNTSDLVYIH